MHPVFVRYTAKPDQSAALRDLVLEHWPTLHRAGLTSERPAVVVSVDRDPGTFIEFYEWASREAVERAHRDPTVRSIWDRMEEIGRVEPWDGQYLLPPGDA